VGESLHDTIISNLFSGMAIYQNIKTPAAWGNLSRELGLSSAAFPIVSIGWVAAQT
jgi:hypothetical protein